MGVLKDKQILWNPIISTTPSNSFGDNEEEENDFYKISNYELGYRIEKLILGHPKLNFSQDQ